MAQGMTGASGSARGEVRFAPVGRFSYWPASALCAGLGIGIAWFVGLPEVLSRIGEPGWLTELLILLLVTALVPFLCALLALFLPFQRLEVIVRGDGLIATPASGRGEIRLRWEDVERIVGRSRRGAISLDFRLRPGHGRRRWDLVSDRYIGDPRDVLEAIRDLAPDGGYTLEGHRLDVRFWGGEEWRLVPLDRPTIPAHRQGAPAGAPHSRPAGGVSGRSPAPCRSDAPR
ncbi:hypothetical protein N8I71_19060 [Roseibacterium sp. SDUM158016]|uniref:hypothetical protein n=1 Tax=Roseicyclus sediminis TaxID=2980997 RepID=UPI0021D1AE0A|nr:hypothetical protein [Roseibacterium sp. SDUM158016]MCU4654944.1 hypothetical protein [Roseibacterium sp. SDUM158016]